MATNSSEKLKWTEIERRFLLSEIPYFIKIQIKKHITQWYLPSFRIRKIGEDYKMTIKRWSWLEREEVEIDITKEEFECNWQIGQKNSLQKNRYYLENNWYTNEVDDFEWKLQWLFILEIEFTTKEEAEKFIPPIWFSKEITEMNEFSNKNLATNWISEEMQKIIDDTKNKANIWPIEMNLDDWINWVVTWLQNLVEKINWERPIFALIVGWSNSGKTRHVSEKIIEKLELAWITVSKISADNFYKGPSFMTKMKELWVELNWDMPEAIDYKLLLKKLGDLYKWDTDITIPSYDFKHDPIMDWCEIKNAQVIIVEWLHLFNWEIDRDFGDLKIFVNISNHSRNIRKLLRDALKERRTWQSPEEVLNYTISEVNPMDQKYIQPQKPKAHIIINNGRNPQVESLWIEEKQNQVKYKINKNLTENWDAWDILKSLESLGFSLEDIKYEKDIYYKHKEENTEFAWETLKIRDSYKMEPKSNDKNCYWISKKPSKYTKNIKYKFSEKISSWRFDHFFEFGINDETQNLVELEYNKIWIIKKKRFVFKKDSITLNIDIWVCSDMNWKDKQILGNFIEIVGNISCDEIENIKNDLWPIFELDKQKINSNYINMEICEN